VDSSNISSNHPTKKLVFKRVGPFPVIKKVGSSAYELQIPKIWKNLHPVINESKLKALSQTNLHSATRNLADSYHTQPGELYTGSRKNPEF